MVERLIRDGKVAVMYSPAFGAGWSTWNEEHADFCLFDARLAELVLAKRLEDAEAYIEARGLDLYTGGLADLEVGWVPKGAQFYIHEYDGNERLITSFRTA